MTSHDDVFDTPEARQPTILSVYNQKGGVGKTTTSVNLALALAAMGKSVVLIDFDPQSSATSNFLLKERAKVGIHDLLNKDTFVEDAITPTNFAGLSMIVGARKLYSMEHALDSRGGSQRGLRKALHFSTNPPDYVVIDCPPALGHLAAGALAASDRLVLPVFPGRYALDGLRRTLSVVDHIQKGLNPNLSVAGVLMLSVSNDEVGRDSLTQLRAEYAELMFKTVVPYDVDVVKATYRRMPAAIFSPTGRTASRFLALAHEIIHGRGTAATEEQLKPALDRIQAWHDETDSSYTARRAASPGEEGDDGTPTGGAQAATAGTRPRFGLAIAAAIVGLVVGFALGATVGAPLVGPMLAGLGG
ncbi:AAA family ATPase [Azospirillum sp. RWY-5-1]|uniref:AAA family ATPase n=1 Tax=Azospirillum oleiclasticum TaxID=2735135 RepID=A0ABX2TDS1_9PROT|nr:AAA family ATPase [Azospirillum oleiclasticum]NYZ15449.1 AAA family ATPase [Azospirillum oleiclasticum]NYZ22472.1 AAA family ATPase [Azospirillum oleiclasticum]